jgi:choline-sulfatase
MARSNHRPPSRAPRSVSPATVVAESTSRGRPALIGAGAAIALAAIFLAARWFWPLTIPSAARPNVLLITIDTLRADRLGCYGDRDAATPVLDALAARGVRFPDAVAHVPLTLPSHATILTGVTPLKHGVRDNAGFVLGPSLRTLAEQFRAAGFDTAAFVSGFPVHHRFGLGRGFDVYDDRFPRGEDPARPPYVERRGDQTVAAAIAWLARRPDPGTRPFFIWLHLFDPHAPYDPPEPFKSRFSARPYDGEVAFADVQIGVLLGRLQQAGLRDQTLILATSDHGEGLGEHGEPTHGLFIYDSTIRVPLILAGPGVSSGRVVAPLARGIDIAPTLLDLARLPPLPGAEGRSLKATWGERKAVDESAYVESLFGRLSFGWAPLYGWRDRQMMFIDAPRPELYDVEADPGQLHDLSGTRTADAGRYRRIIEAAVSGAPAAQPGPTSREARDRLRSLGYTGGAGSITNPSLRDPKDCAVLAVRIENAMAAERADPKKAIEEFALVLKEDPSNLLARRHLAVALTAERRYDDALAELRQLVAAGDTSAETLVFMGDCYRLSGLNEKALDAFRRAAERDPQIPDPINGQGKTLVAMGRRDEGRQAFERTLVLEPGDPEALGGLADLAIERGDLTGARARLEALRGRDGEDTSVALKLGVVLVRLGELDRAIELFTEVLGRQPGNVDAAVDLGGALAKSGRPAEAVPYFERAIAAGARSPVVFNSLGFARLESGNQPGAIEALRQSLRVRPDQPNIVAMLQKLEGR